MLDEFFAIMRHYTAGEETRLTELPLHSEVTQPQMPSLFVGEGLTVLRNFASNLLLHARERGILWFFHAL